MALARSRTWADRPRGEFPFLLSRGVKIIIVAVIGARRCRVVFDYVVARVCIRGRGVRRRDFDERKALVRRGR